MSLIASLIMFCSFSAKISFDMHWKPNAACHLCVYGCIWSHHTTHQWNARFGAMNESVSMAESNCGCPCHVHQYRICPNMPHFDVFRSWFNQSNEMIFMQYGVQTDVAWFCPGFCFVYDAWNMFFCNHELPYEHLWVGNASNHLWQNRFGKRESIPSVCIFLIHFLCTFCIQPAMRNRHRCGLAAQNYRQRNVTSWVHAKNSKYWAAKCAIQIVNLGPETNAHLKNLKHLNWRNADRDFGSVFLINITTWKQTSLGLKLGDAAGGFVCWRWCWGASAGHGSLGYRVC